MENDMETSEAARLRTLELDMMQVRTLVDGMRDDVHTIRNAIVYGMVTLMAILFGLVGYFVNQKDQIVSRLDRIIVEQPHEASYDNDNGATQTTTSSSTTSTRSK